MKVMYVIPTLNSGGVENCVLNMANYLSELDHTVYILTSDAAMHKFFAYNVIFIFHNVDSKNPIKIWLNSFKIRSLCREHKIDILHPKSRAPAWSCYLAAKKLANTKLIYTVHGSHSYSNCIKKYYSSIIKKYSNIISVSFYITDYLKKIYNIDANNVHTINRGVDLNKFTLSKISNERISDVLNKMNIDNTSKKILFFPSRFSSRKGHLWLLDTIASLKNLDFVCIMSGDIEKNKKFYKQIISKIKILNLEDKIKVVNTIRDMPAAYWISHAVISPSTKPESFGFIPVEAAASGRPTIVSNSGNLSYNVINKETGWVVKANDQYELTIAIKYAIYLTSEQWNEMSKKARNFAEKNFNLQKTLEKTYEVYNSLL